MLQSCRIRRFKLLAVGGMLALIGLATALPGTVRAQDDGNDNALSRLENRLFGGILRGLGLRSADDPAIEYRERSPLVVPPSRDLPPPQANVVQRNPAWPVDPDVKRAKDRADAKRRMTAGNPNYNINDGNVNLTPAELDPPGSRTTTGSTGGGSTSVGADGKPLLPSQLGYTGGLFGWASFGFGTPKQEVGTFTSEPPRTSLTEPPPGYQTPSPAQPYGVTRRTENEPVKPADTAVGR